MKVIFLDVDGVLNSDEYFEKVFNLIKNGAKIQGIERNVDVNKVKLLKEATDLTDAKVVLSTSVRYSQAGDLIKELLLKYGISVISETPFLNNERGKEIKEWLDEHTDIEDFVIIGSKVLVPFGNSKTLEEAFVVGIKEKSSYEVKDIAKLEENLTDKQIQLARWMAKKYFSTVSDCIKLMLTPGTRTKNKENRIDDKLINTLYLKKDEEEIDFDIETKKLKSEKQIRILNFLKQNEGATIPEVEMFTDTSRAIINTLIKNEYIEVVEKKVQRNPLLERREVEKTTKLKLTDEQQKAYEIVEKSIEKSEVNSYLLYGVTGSNIINTTNAR